MLGVAEAAGLMFGVGLEAGVDGVDGVVEAAGVVGWIIGDGEAEATGVGVGVTGAETGGRFGETGEVDATEEDATGEGAGAAGAVGALGVGAIGVVDGVASGLVVAAEPGMAARGTAGVAGVDGAGTTGAVGVGVAPGTGATIGLLIGVEAGAGATGPAGAAFFLPKLKRDFLGALGSFGGFGGFGAFGPRWKRLSRRCLLPMM